MEEIEWLYSLDGSTKLGLERVLGLLDRLGNPHKKIKCIHVAGTNGKGSTCAMIFSILKKAGFKVGMYTSPHLKDFNERFRKNEGDISDKELKELVEKVKPFVKGETFFEVTTAIAFLYFKEVDYLVLEVGLGGRLDATNVVKPLVSVITNISKEHTEYLGETIEKIAFEKAGIIKEGVPLITLAENSALKVIKEIAKEKKVKVKIPHVKKIEINLNGEYQLKNAAMAIEVCKLLDISNGIIKEGLKEIDWKGRLEYIEKNILVDSAHNPAGVEILSKEISLIKKEKVISIVGILKNKAIKEMISKIEEFSDYIIFVKPNGDMAEEPEELAKKCRIRHEVIHDVNKAVKKAKKLANLEDLIVVTGSIYTVGLVL